MPTYDLGTARGVIEIDYRGNGATQASRDLRGAGQAAGDASTRVNDAGNQLAATGAVIAAGLGFAVNAAADFEAKLSAVEAVSGASAAEMEQLRAKSLQLGKDTAFSASEGAAAIEELVKAGISVQDVMNGAADATVALAAAGQIELPEAASIASNAMNQFGLAAADLPNVANQIAGAANASAIDVSDFGFALSQVGAVANLAGASFDDTATAIALLGNAGIKGSDAGTSLKTFLSNLQPTTEKQIDLFKQLGIVTEDGANKFFTAEGSLKSLSDISGTLQESLEGMTKQQQQATLETLFGSDAIRAAAILANNGAEGFDKMAESMGKVTAAEVAEKRLDNLNGSLEALKGSFETLMIVIGTPLLNLLRGVVEGATSILNVILEIPGPILEAVTAFLGIASAGLILAGVFLKVKAAIAAGSLAVTLLSGPIGLVIIAVAALIAAFIFFYKNSEQFRAIVQDIGRALKDFLGRAIETIVPLLKQLGEFLVDAFQRSLPFIKQFGTFLVDSFNAALPFILKFIGFVQELAGVFVRDVLPVIIQVGGTIVRSLVSAFNKVVPAVAALIPMIGDFIGAVKGLFSAITSSPVFEYIIGVLKILAGVFVSTIIPLLVRVGGIFVNTFVNIVGTAIRTALGIVRGILNIIIGVIKVFTGLLTGNWSKAWEGVKQILKGAVGFIGTILRGLLSTAGAIIKGLGNVLVAGVKAIPGLLKGAGQLFLNAGKFLIDAFVEGIKNAAGLIEGIATNVWNFVRGLLNGAIGKINSALEFTISLPLGKSVGINPPDIPALASGGVVNSATLALIGEGSESEAVLPLSKLREMLDEVYKAGADKLLMLDMASGPRDLVAAPSGGGMRVVSGELRIDPSGRAFIRGIAEEVVDEESNFTARRGRVGAR